MKIGNDVKSSGSITQSVVKSKFKGVDIQLSDSHWDLISREQMQKVIDLNRFTTSNYSFQSRVRDCDDYSFALMGMVRKLLPGVCFGIVWVDVVNSKGVLQYKHAINFFIDSNKQLWFVEPQINMIFSPSSVVKPFFVIL